jgi:hypothetical protein
MKDRKETINNKFAADHEPFNQDNHGRVHKKGKASSSFLPQYRLQAYGVQNQSPDLHRISVAGTQKKAPRFSERSLIPEGEALVLKSVFSLSTLRALSAETSENTQKTSAAMPGATTVSPLLFMNNLQQLMAAANRRNKKPFDAVALENTESSEPHNHNHKRRPRH